MTNQSIRDFIADVNRVFSRKLAVEREFTGKVENIMGDKFILKVDNDEICCSTEQNSEYLVEGENYTVTGVPRLVDNSIVLRTTLIVKENHETILKNMERSYDKIKKSLNKEKYLDYLNKIKNTTIYGPFLNVAVIGLATPAMLEFQEQFSKRCKGSLYVYGLTGENFMNSVRSAIMYFQKYLNIEVIVILNSGFSREQMYLLSKPVVLNLFTNRSVHYFQCNTDENPTLIPLTNRFMNRNFVTVTETIADIQNTQSIFYDSVMKTKEKLYEQIHLHLARDRDHLLNRTNIIESMNPTTKKNIKPEVRFSNAFIEIMKKRKRYVDELTIHCCRKLIAEMNNFMPNQTIMQ